MTTRAHARLAYNGALDGLRALAVIAVVYYHAGALGGGWIGVEVFFVLSGYLITAILIREYDSTGRIDLLDFWRRRARRLLPGIGLLVLLVAAYQWWWAGPVANRSLDRDLVGLLTYTSNWVSLGGDGYWQQFDAPSPLRHAWSLAVEEQFYLLFPLLAMLVLPSSRRRGWLLALAVLAVVWQVAATGWLDVERVYLGTDTRAFGLLAGAALAATLAASSTGSIAVNRSRAPMAAIGAAGMAALVVCAVVFDDATTSTFRGPFQVVVVASLAVIVDVVIHTDGVAHRLLAVEPLRLVGRWSYGIYLFHWPLLLAIDERADLSPAVLGTLVAAATIPLAGLSYRFVEGPIREGRLAGFGSPGRWLAPTAAAAAVVAVAAVVATNTTTDSATAADVASREITVNAPATDSSTDAPSEMTSEMTSDSLSGSTVAPTAPPATATADSTPTTTPPVTSSPSAGSATTIVVTAPATSAPNTIATTTPTTIPLVPRPPDRPVRIYVAGDSLGDSIGTSLEADAADFGIEVFTRAAGGCGFDRERMQYFNGDVEPAACRDLVAAWRPDVEAFRPDAVVIAYAGWWGWFRDGRIQTQCEPELADHVRSLYDLALADLHASGAPVYFVSPPNWEGDPVGPDGIPAMFDCVRNVLTDWVDANGPAARLIDVASMLCRGDRCDATIDGEPARPDGIHFSDPTASAMMAALLAEVTEPPAGGWPHAATITPPG